MSKTYEDVMSVDITKLDEANLANLKTDVLSLSHDDIIKFLEHIIDDVYEYYDETAKDENSPNVVKFLTDNDLKVYIEEIYKNSNE